MPKAPSLLVLLVVLAGICHRTYAQGITPSAPNKASAMKTQNFEATIKIGDSATPSDCSLVVSVHNIGSELLALRDNFTGTYSCGVSLSSPPDKACAYTDLGKGALGPVIRNGSSKLKTLPPGARFTFTIPLEKFFRLNAGPFRLRFRLSIASEKGDLSVELPDTEFDLRGGGIGNDKP